MDSYNVIITPHALSQLNDYISYIQYTLFNDEAAKKVWKDAIDTANILKSAAGSFHYCNHPKLEQLGYRQIQFTKHKYVLIYRINGHNVYVEAIYHSLQDYENTFSLIADSREDWE